VRGESYDAVIVGGGHNGLVAGCFLARAGRRVLVLEKNDHAGGMTTSLPLVTGAPHHLISPGAYENVYLRASGIVEELGLARYGYREHDSAGWAWLGDDGRSLIFQRDVEATVGEIARFSRADARRYRELVPIALRIMTLQNAYGARHPGRPGLRLTGQAIRALAGDRAVRSTLGGMLAGTASDVISSLS
jgi:phytoene dehydrogenase-like protein